MNKLVKLVVGILVGLVVLVAIGVASTPKENTGGNFNPVNQDVYSLSILGTEVISNSRGLTGTTLTMTGASSIGSITAGLNYYRPVVDLTADTTVTVAQTNTVFNMGTAGVDVTLPAPTVAAGVNYRFLVSAAFATTDMTIISGTADLISGSLIVAGAVVACDLADIITIAAANEDVGDFIDLYSNGVNWMIGANQAMTAGNHACSG
jgi:hypothetical protein